MVKEMPCSACAHDNPLSARFCGACGEPLKTGLKRPGTVSLALPYPPQVQQASFGDETLAGVGIASPQKTWAVLAGFSALLFVIGAVTVYVSVTPRGPAQPDAPVLIGTAEPAAQEESFPNDLPSDLPEGVDLDALVARAVPGPESVDGSGPSVPSTDATRSEPGAEEPEEPTAQTMQTTRRRTRGSQMRVAPPEALPPTYPPVDTTMAQAPTSSDTESPYTAATYGPAARRTVSSRYMGDVERCFGAADGRTPGFSGTVLVAYMLSETGQVASSRIARNTTGDSQLGECLTSAARRWTLPRPPRRTLEFSMSFAR